MWKTYRSSVRSEVVLYMEECERKEATREGGIFLYRNFDFSLKSQTKGRAVGSV